MTINKTSPTLFNYMLCPYTVKTTSNWERAAKIAMIGVHILLSIPSLGAFSVSLTLIHHYSYKEQKSGLGTINANNLLNEAASIVKVEAGKPPHSDAAVDREHRQALSALKGTKDDISMIQIYVQQFGIRNHQ